MTKLDAKALEAAIAAWKPGPISTEERAISLITAYLDALPPAWRTSLEVRTGSTFPYPQYKRINVEIREVRS